MCPSIIILGDDGTHEVQGRGAVPMRGFGDCIKIYRMYSLFLA